MQSEKRRKFIGKSYRVSDLKQGPNKKKLVNGLMSSTKYDGILTIISSGKIERASSNVDNSVLTVAAFGIVLESNGINGWIVNS